MTGQAQAAFFPLIPGGKLPAIEEWQHVQPGIYPPIGNYGRSLTAADIVLDADPRNYPEGRDILQELLSLHKVPQTRVVRTARGGYHMYFTKLPALKLRKKQSLFPGIDFLSEGCYTVQPGSITEDGEYKTIIDVEPAELPASLIAVLEQRSEADNVGTEVSLLMFDSYKAECEIAAPAIAGDHGDDTTYFLACRGRDMGLPKEAVFQLMRDYWNPRCLPAWEDQELFKKVVNAYRYARNAAGNNTPEARFLQEKESSNVVQMQTYQHEIMIKGMVPEQLTLDKKGNIVNTLGNICYLLRHDAAWKGRIRFNEFSNTLEFRDRPEWRKAQKNVGVELTKRDIACIRTWFSTAGHVRLEVSIDDVRSALLATAIPYHPVRDYLDNLVWDGKPRLDTILIDTAGADDMPYTREVGKCTLIAAVKRIYEPGCKHDHVLILESRQGMKKSTWISVLGGEWYSANELVRGDKDSYQNLRGRWFVELPEINATFTKADFNWLKGIISNPVDVYRGSYAETSAAVPRESVFIGSINPNGTGTYLKDDENRRYWPVRVGLKRFDITRLQADRDQYFAEAVHRYKAGESHWIEDEELLQAATQEQDSRKERDPWSDVLEGWAHAHAHGFEPKEVYAVLGFNAANIQSNHRIRLYNALRAIGFEHRKTGNSGIWLRESDWGKLI